MPTALTAQSESQLRPPLKWAGGKRWQVPLLRKYWEPHTRHRLVEPFAGGIAVAMGLAPDRALLNDANPHLINFYNWLKRGLRTSLPFENREALYYEHRARFNALMSRGRENTAEAAALFYYLNRTGYNGLCRFNRSGGFNVPFGRYARINYVRDFSPYAIDFSGWDFSTGDFEEIALKPTDFVYADPPYDVEFTAYSRGGFTWKDQQRTARFCAAHRGPVVLVNQATDRVVRLYESLGYTLTFVNGPRRISCDGNRTPAREVVATRNLG